jgi:hypothetical protein
VLCCAWFVRSYSPYTRVFSRFLFFDPSPSSLVIFFGRWGFVCSLVRSGMLLSLPSASLLAVGLILLPLMISGGGAATVTEPWIFLPLNREKEPFVCMLIDLCALRAAIRQGRGFGGSQGVSVRFGGKGIFPPNVRVLSQLLSLRFFAARGRNKIRLFRWRISLLTFSLSKF